MIVMRLWIKKKKLHDNPNGWEWRTEHWRGFFLFGVIPLFIQMTSLKYTVLDI